MTPDERTQLAVAEEYERRLRQLTEDLRGAPWTTRRGTHTALEIVARARAAELRDPEPSPYTIR